MACGTAFPEVYLGVMLVQAEFLEAGHQQTFAECEQINVFFCFYDLTFMDYFS